MLNFPRQPFAAEVHAAALGKQRLNNGDAQFDRFLQGVIHLVAARNAWRQHHPQRRFRLAGQDFGHLRLAEEAADSLDLPNATSLTVTYAHIAKEGS